MLHSRNTRNLYNTGHVFKHWFVLTDTSFLVVKFLLFTKNLIFLFLGVLSNKKKHFILEFGQKQGEEEFQAKKNFHIKKCKSRIPQGGKGLTEIVIEKFMKVKINIP